MNIEKIAAVLMALTLIFSVFFMLFYCKQYYHYEFEKLRVYDGKNNEKIVQSLDDLFVFFSNKNIQIRNYNENEISHMADVRKIFNYMKLFLILSAISLGYILIHYKISWKEIFRDSGIIIVAVSIIFLAASLIDFNAAFTKFHEILFPNGNYMFNPKTSFMKQMFPDEFFINFLKMYLSILLIAGIILESAYFCLKKH